MFAGWFSQIVMLFFKAALAVTFTYCVFRVRFHKRNHELTEHDKRNRELAEIIGYCIVIGCALAI
jgi:heme/copper-type cytochrome/quinol oxidase subunit 2